MARVEDNREEYEKRLNNALKVAFKSIGLTMQANAVIEINKAVYDTPESPNYVRTGNLRSSLEARSAIQTDERSATVGTNVEYAPYVEYGTSRGMPPRPFLRPAIENHMTEYENILAIELGEVGEP